MAVPPWFAALAADTAPAVRAAMQRIDRDAFLPVGVRAARDADQALPLDVGQTISQPSLVAAMLTWLDVRPGQRVLDVGAGSGYVAALLAELVGPTGQVIALERQGRLVAQARAVLGRLAPIVDLRHADGLGGARDAAPFARIHLGCACDRVPRALRDQLGDGGRLILPIGPLAGDQVVTVVERSADTWQTRHLDTVRFVPALPGTVAAD